MDWGCGLGRSSVFFMQMFGLQSSKFILVDGHSKMYGTKENLTDSQRLFHQDVVPIFEKNETFYTDFDLIDRFVTSNGMQFFNLINLNKTENQLTQIPEKVEIFYSFHSIGYHWDILPTLDYYKIHDILKKNALLIFGIRRNRSALSKELRIDDLPKKGYEIINKIEGDYHQGFLVLRKQF